MGRCGAESIGKILPVKKGREIIGWIGLVTVCLTALVMCAALTWAAIPRERGLELGSVSDLPTGQPEHRALAIGTIYLVNLNGTPIAWEARAPVEGTRCIIRWVPTTTRFEDPCSGNKWCLDGTMADNTYGADRTLDRYVLEVDADGTVWLQPLKQATGVPRWLSDTPDLIPSPNYHCDHLAQ